MKDQEIDKVRRSLSSSVSRSRERDDFENVKIQNRETSIDIKKVESSEEIRSLNWPLPIKDRP